MFKYTRIYSDPNGDTHFEESGIQLQDGGTIGRLSEMMPADGIIFREVEPAYDYDFHTAPRRQYVVLLDGAIEIETSLGEKRIFETGEVLLLKDVTGKGHKTKNLNPEKRRSLFISVP
ncbi:MAG: hypothetical protein ACXWB9_01355 [Flavisolibacter sp.]